MCKFMGWRMEKGRSKLFYIYHQYIANGVMTSSNSCVCIPAFIKSHGRTLRWHRYHDQHSLIKIDHLQT